MEKTIPTLQVGDPWHTVALVENILMVWPSGYDDGIPGRGSFNCSHSTGPKGPICDPKMRAEKGDTFCYPSCPLCDPQNSCDWSSCADDKGFIRYLMEEVVGQWYAALCAMWDIEVGTFTKNINLIKKIECNLTGV